MKATAHKGELRQFKSCTVYHNEPPERRGPRSITHPGSPRHLLPAHKHPLGRALAGPLSARFPSWAAWLGSPVGAAPGPAHGAVLARGARPGCAADPGERRETPPGSPRRRQISPVSNPPGQGEK